MEQAKRWRGDWERGEYLEDAEGKWVFWSDYNTLLVEHDRLQRALDALRGVKTPAEIESALYPELKREA